MSFVQIAVIFYLWECDFVSFAFLANFWFGILALIHLASFIKKCDQNCGA